MIRATGQTVVVRRDSPEMRTKSGIWFPETVGPHDPERKEAVETGVVLAVGPGLVSRKTGKHLPLAVEPGDKVYFTYSAGEEIEVDGETLLFVWETHIQGVIER